MASSPRLVAMLWPMARQHRLGHRRGARPSLNGVSLIRRPQVWLGRQGLRNAPTEMASRDPRCVVSVARDC